MSTCSLASIQEASDAPLWLRHSMKPRFLQHCQNMPLQVLAYSARMQVAHSKSSSRPTGSSRLISGCWREVVRLRKNVDKHSSRQAQTACSQKDPVHLTALYQKVFTFMRHHVTPAPTARAASCEACAPCLAAKPASHWK